MCVLCCVLFLLMNVCMDVCLQQYNDLVKDMRRLKAEAKGLKMDLGMKPSDQIKSDVMR